MYFCDIHENLRSHSGALDNNYMFPDSVRRFPFKMMILQNGIISMHKHMVALYSQSIMQESK